MYTKFITFDTQTAERMAYKTRVHPLKGFAMKTRFPRPIATLLIAISSIFALGNPAFSQVNAAEQRKAHAVENVVQISAQASTEVIQDLLQITLGTTKEGSEAEAVQQQLKAAVDTALAAAKSQAAPGQLEVRTGQFSLYPRYDRNGKINGWQGNAEVVLQGKDFARISQVAGKIQSLQMRGVNFSLSREARQKAESEVTLRAIENYRQKAAEVSKAFGFGNYTLREVSVMANEQGVIQQQPRMMSMKSASADMESSVPVEGGKAAVVVMVNGSVVLAK
jgi:predicted secreted protein